MDVYLSLPLRVVVKGGGLIDHLFSSRDASFASTVMLYALFSINLNVSMLGDHFHFISLTDAVE